MPAETWRPRVQFEIVPVGASVQASEGWTDRRAGVLSVARAAQEPDRPHSRRDLPVDLTIAGAAHDAYPIEALDRGPLAPTSPIKSPTANEAGCTARHVHILHHDRDGWSREHRGAAGGAQLVVSDRDRRWNISATMRNSGPRGSVFAKRGRSRPARSQGDSSIVESAR